MAVNRATKTLTLAERVNIVKDTYTDQALPTTNFGANSALKAGDGDASDRKFFFITLKMPDVPSDADTSIDYSGIAVGVGSGAIRLYLFRESGGATMNLVLDAVRTSWVEDTVIWNDQPGVDYNIHGGISIGAGPSYKLLDITNFAVQGKKWGDILDIRGSRDSVADSNTFDFRSRENTGGSRPYIEVLYYQRPPAQITTLTIVADPDDASRPKLTWTPSRDLTFSKYQVFRKVGAGAYAQVGSDITVQGQGEYVDTAGGLTENNVVLYKVRESNVDGSYNESNEVWLIRPDVSTFTLDDATPDVNQKIIATVAPVAIATTPTPVTNTDYYYQWGDGAESDTSSGWSKTATRPHIYGYAGSQTPKCRVKNSLGFYSDLTSLTAGGPTVTVASIAPVAKLKAAPMVQLTSTNVTFYGDESYSPPANKGIHAATGYEWDQDYTGAFVADFTTALPTQAMTWPTTGTKTVALRVKDVDGTYSPVVSMTMEIVASVLVNLDALVDGFEVLDHERSRQTLVYEGLDAYETARAGLRPQTVKIGGFAFTDADSDNIPDDLETIMDVIANNKKVQLTVLGTVRTGTLRGLPVHTEGGWDFKYNWSVDVVLDP